jgi:hypothetical protein
MNKFIFLQTNKSTNYCHVFVTRHGVQTGSYTGQKLIKNLFLTLHGHNMRCPSLSCLLWGRGTSFQDGVAAREGFLCAPF